jgi:hypothetical protein
MTRMRRLVFAFCAGAALAACSSGGAGGSGPTINSFTATPSSLPAGGGSVTLAWNVNGATSLSIDQSVGAVTPATSGSKSVQVTSSTTFTLTATGSSGNSTMTAAVTVAAGPVTITVNGTVTDEYGAINPGQTVLITNTSASFSQSAISSATGTFSVANVPTPYDATVLDSGGTVVVQYLGLTRADPALMDLVVGPTPLSSSLAGQLSGGTFPQTSGYETNMFFASPQTNLGNGSLSVSTSGAYSEAVDWAGPSTTTGTLYALQIHTVSGLPADYSYGTKSNVLLQDMGALTGQNIALSSVTAGTLSGAVTVPAGYTLTNIGAYFVPGDGALVQAFADTSPSTSFSYVSPAVPNSTLDLLVQATGPGSSLLLFKKEGISANTTGIAATIVAPPSQLLPVAAATGVSVTTQFSWTNTAGVYLFAATGSGANYYVFTTATTGTIPDLSAVGVQLPASAAYQWLIVGIAPQTSVDSLAIPGGLIGLELVDGTFSESAERDFTTSP